MPCLSDLEIKVIIAESHIRLTQTQLGSSRDTGHTGIEIGLDLGAHVPAAELISLDIHSETGGQGGEAEGADRIEVVFPYHILILGHIIEQILDARKALT